MNTAIQSELLMHYFIILHSFPVVGRYLGGHVDGRRGGEDKVLGGLVVALLAADHQVVEELAVLEQVVGLVVLLDEVRDDLQEEDMYK